MFFVNCPNQGTPEPTEWFANLVEDYVGAMHPPNTEPEDEAQKQSDEVIKKSCPIFLYTFCILCIQNIKPSAWSVGGEGGEKDLALTTKIVEPRRYSLREP